MSTITATDVIDLDSLTREALVTAIWTGLVLSENLECATIDEKFPEIGPDDVPDDIRADIRQRLAAFIETHSDDVLEYLAHDRIVHSGYPPADMLAHDYVLTVDGHGAGFWDRGLGHLGNRLAGAARADGSINLHADADGRLYA